MQLELSKKEFRRLLDMVYIGNWILNSTRGEDRFQDYDKVESLLFEKARQEGMGILAETYQGETIPSRPFGEGGIHEAIMEHENNVFFDILAEDLARRDMNDAPIDAVRSLLNRLLPLVAGSKQKNRFHRISGRSPYFCRGFAGRRIVCRHSRYLWRVCGADAGDGFPLSVLRYSFRTLFINR